MSSAIEMVLEGLEDTRQRLAAQEAAEKKAFNSAVKLEAYRLMTLLKAEIAAGDPGGEQFEPLTIIAQRTSAIRHQNRPLSTLARAIGYRVSNQDPFTCEIGFVDKPSIALSKSWQRIAEQVQSGQTFPVTDRLRQLFVRYGGTGGGYAWGRNQKGQQAYALKKDTTELDLPARPIISPFWRAHENEVIPNIEKNYEMKRAGHTWDQKTGQWLE